MKLGFLTAYLPNRSLPASVRRWIGGAPQTGHHLASYELAMELSDGWVRR